MAMNKRFKVSALAAAVAAAGSVVPAYGFEYVKDDFRMQVDTTVSVGASWRAEDRDYRGVGSANAAAAGEPGHYAGTRMAATSCGKKALPSQKSSKPPLMLS